MNSRQLLKSSSLTILETLQRLEYGDYNKPSELNELGRVLPKLIKESLKHPSDINWLSIRTLSSQIAEELILLMKTMVQTPRVASGFLSWLAEYKVCLALLVEEEDKKVQTEELANNEEINNLLNW